MTNPGSPSEPLLRIDHEAALAKLAGSQLQGPWELPAELVRLTISRAARSVDLRIQADHLVLTAEEMRLEHEAISDFASILDQTLDPSERHRALVKLEERDAFALSVIACSKVDALILTTGRTRPDLPGADRSSTDSEGMRLELRRDGELLVTPPRADGPGSGLELTVHGLGIDAERAVRWLARMGRFARIPLTVNGRRIDRGFESQLVRGRIAARAQRPANAGERQGGLPPSLPADLAISRHGGAPRLWLLRHGIVSTRATVPGYPPFEAAVEMAPVASGGLGAAALRERLGPYLRSLLDGALSLAIRLANRPKELPEKVRVRTARILLEALGKRRRVAEISGVRIFPLVTTEGRRLISIDEIARRVRVEAGGTCALDAIPPDQDPGSFALTERGALVLSDNERALLGDHLCVVFSAPPAKLRRSWRHRLTAGLGDLLASRRFARGRLLPEEDLSPDERAFIAQLRAALASSMDAVPQVELRSGSGPAIQAGSRLMLARSNPDVRLAVRTTVRRPEWLYPAMAALFDKPLAGFDLARSEPRRQWFRAVG